MSHITAGDADADRLANYVMGRFGEPAYIRRARGVEDAHAVLLERYRKRRTDLLREVHRAFSAVRPLLRKLSPELATIEQAVGPTDPAASAWRLRPALRQLTAAVQRFNAAWAAFLSTLDLSDVNARRDGYNRYYLLEKECALRSARLAEIGFRPLPPLTTADLAAVFPPLPLPRC